MLTDGEEPFADMEAIDAGMVPICSVPFLFVCFIGWFVVKTDLARWCVDRSNLTRSGCADGRAIANAGPLPRAAGRAHARLLAHPARTETLI